DTQGQQQGIVGVSPKQKPRESVAPVVPPSIDRTRAKVVNCPRVPITVRSSIHPDHDRRKRRRHCHVEDDGEGPFVPQARDGSSRSSAKRRRQASSPCSYENADEHKKNQQFVKTIGSVG